MFYNFMLVSALVLLSPGIAMVLILNKKWREGLSERLGIMETGARKKLAGAKSIWFHGASMGEAQAFVPVIRELKKLSPDYSVVVTTTSVTGRERVKRELGELITHCCLLPLDLPFLAGGFIDAVNPAALITVETELWPNLITQVSKRGIPLIMMNGRISKRTFGGYYAFRLFFGPLLSKYSLLIMQSEKMARRLKLLGLRDSSKIMIQSNTKYSAAEARRDPDFDFDKKGRFVVVAGSIRKGEEEGIVKGFLAASDGEMTLIIAPRHLKRAGHIMSLCAKQGASAVLKSSLSSAAEILHHRICVLDTMGELAKIYAIGDAAIIGGGFVKIGGHNPMEAAAMGLPVIFGRHMFNFEDTADRLIKEGGAFRLENPETELGPVLLELKGNPGKRKYIGEKNRAVIERYRGSAATTAVVINEVMIDRKMEAAK